jgi:uracil-DNA glycosylase family 4
MQFDLLDAEYNEVLAQPTYVSFCDALRAFDCRRCPLGSSRDKIVIDRGNPKSQVMIISERPGENENREGRAFVGRAGELLDKIFAAIGMDTDRDLIITNVVKCMPPVDRQPTAAEARACLPYLERQIALIKPRLIILLGAVALKFVTGETGDVDMEDCVGRFFTMAAYPEIQFVVLYHPAFLLRDPRKKRDMWEHVQKIRDFLKTNELSAQKDEK